MSEHEENNIAPLWEMQENEGIEAFAAFVRYRDMGPGRTITKAAEELQKGDRLLYDWSQTHSWQLRIRAWEREEDRVRREAHFEKIREMTRTHTTVARAIIGKCVTRIQTIDAQTLSAAMLIKWFEVAVKIERLSYGQATEIYDEFASMSDEDLLTYLQNQTNQRLR